MASEAPGVDLLIIGAGPAGLMAAMWAAACGITTRVIDKRPNKIQSGHGDGINMRTIESMFSFGVSDAVTKAAVEVMSGRQWRTDDKGHVYLLTESMPFDAPSPFGFFLLSQAKLGDIMTDYVTDNSPIRIERGKIAESLKVDSSAEYPVTVEVREAKVHGSAVANNDLRIDDDAAILEASRLNGNAAAEVIRAKYVVACDGAHSWTRRTLNIAMEGDDIDAIWGVADVVPVTNFPSPRTINMIVGKSTGLLWIPRERGMIRIYTVLGKAQSDEQGKMVRSSITVEAILEAARENMQPYEMEFARVDWWAAYQIGQRVAADNIDTTGRVFLAGDAVHTHSPQAGQGMNISIADTYNLVWKLGLVVKGLAKPEILDTYRSERLVEAQKLIMFDREFAAAASGRDPPPRPDGTVVPALEVLDRSVKGFRLMINGLKVVYPKSLLIAQGPSSNLLETLEEGLPPGIITGMRIPSFHVRRHSDGTIQLLTRALTSNGRFRLIVFGGDISEPARMEYCNSLGAQVASFAAKYTVPKKGVTSTVLEPVLVHTASSLALDCTPFHPAYIPIDAATGGLDYTKICYDEEDIVSHHGIHMGSAYQKYDIDPRIGRLVLVRPDGFVGWQGQLDEFQGMEQYFGAFMK